jgi:hypothetical protein
VVAQDLDLGGEARELGLPVAQHRGGDDDEVRLPRVDVAQVGQEDDRLATRREAASQRYGG